MLPFFKKTIFNLIPLVGIALSYGCSGTVDSDTVHQERIQASYAIQREDTSADQSITFFATFRVDSSSGVTVRLVGNSKIELKGKDNQTKLSPITFITETHYIKSCDPNRSCPPEESENTNYTFIWTKADGEKTETPISSELMKKPSLLGDIEVTEEDNKIKFTGSLTNLIEDNALEGNILIYTTQEQFSKPKTIQIKELTTEGEGQNKKWIFNFHLSKDAKDLNDHSLNTNQPVDISISIHQRIKELNKTPLISFKNSYEEIKKENISISFTN